MKGLLYKESRCLWQYGKSYILMVVIFFALSMTNGTRSSTSVMWLLYPVFFLSALPASLLTADEKDGWLLYCDTLPVTRRQIVTVKYIECALLAVSVCVLAVTAALLRGQTDPLYWEQVVSILPLMPLTGLVAPALVFPAMFRYGTIRGRAVYIGVVLLVAVACAVLVVADITGAHKWSFALTLAVSLAVFAGSWVLSVKWFGAREL